MPESGETQFNMKTFLIIFIVHLEHSLPGPVIPEHNILEHGHSKGMTGLLQATQHLLEAPTVQVTGGEETLE